MLQPPQTLFAIISAPSLQIMGVEGAPEAVARLVAAAPDHLATEAAWVLAYITGGRMDGAGH